MAKEATNTQHLIKHKKTLRLSQLQQFVVIGTVLGDGCLIASRSNLSARLQIRHKVKHKDYVEWKYQFFKNWVLTKPRFDKFNNSWYFRTISHPNLMKIRNMFYITKKLIPNNLNELLVSPLSLAIWFMDDGNGFKHYDGLRISSYAFGQDGNKILQSCLKENFNLETSLLTDCKGHQLLFPKQSAKKLFTIIKPFTIPCMQYKFATLTP